MNESAIKISELNYLSNISSSDFFPIVHSSSLTTDRTDIYALNQWMTYSGSCLSASWSPNGYWTIANNGASNIYNINTGNVGVNQNSPLYPFDVNGTIHTNTTLIADKTVTSSMFSASNYIISNNVSFPIKSANYQQTGTQNQSIYFNSQYGTPFATSTDWSSIFFTDLTGNTGQLNITIGDDAITSSLNPLLNYTIVGPNIEALKRTTKGVVISEWGTSMSGPGQGLSTSSAFFIDTVGGWTYGRVLSADRFVAHDYTTSLESIYGTSSIAVSYTSTTGSSAVGFVGTASTAISASWAPIPPAANYVKAFGSFIFDTTSSKLAPNTTYLKNVFNPGAYNLLSTSSYDSTYTSCSFYFSSPLTNNTYAIIMDTDALVGTIDHGNPFQIISKTNNSFTIKFEQSISGSSTTSTRIPNRRLTQGSFIVASSL